MKKQYFILMLCIVSASFYGQVINIPDANFKNYLLTTILLDTDNDGTSDADLDRNDDGEIEQDEALALRYLAVMNLNIADLTGLEYFYNLIGLDFSFNQVSSVDLHTLQQLRNVKCFNNQLTSIDLCGTAVSILWAEGNPNLTYISVKNNVISTFEASRSNTDNTPPGLPSFMFPVSMETLCYDAAEFNAILVGSNVTLITDCSLDCQGNSNAISGNVVFDYNINGCDVTDLGGSIPIKITRNDAPRFTTHSSLTGQYTIYSYEDMLTLTPQVSSPYYTITPASATTTYTGTGNTETIHFCIIPEGNFPDLSIDIISQTPARPGFDAIYRLVYKNKGTMPLSGQVALNFDDTRLDYVGANPAVSANSEGLISWDFNSIAPFETREITFTLNVNSPMEIPAVNIGDLLSFTANITLNAASDSNPADNVSNFTQVVRGAFDPNDKTVSALIAQAEAPLEYLTYTIRFQNTGNEAAEKVRITDMLDARFDKSSLEIIGASHAFRSILNENGLLEFVFDNINLPGSVVDGPGSHGYVAFKIKPIQGTVSAGESISNEANIYFDFNFPILTNPVSTSYYSILGTAKFKDNIFTLYPNPVNNMVNISIAGQTKAQSIKIYNALGQLTQSIDNPTLEKDFVIDVARLNAGTYFVEVVSDQGKVTKKFVKM